MTITTVPVGAPTHRTEQTLKARHQEALDIVKAIEDREAVSVGSVLAGVLVEKAEALAWVEVTAAGLAAYRSLVRQRGAVGVRSGSRTPGGVIGHAGHSQALRNA